MWKSNEIEYLLNNVKTEHLKDISEHLGKTEKAVRAKAERLGISFTELSKYSSIWSTKEIDILIKNKDKPLKELSLVLNRSISSISYKSNQLGISRQKGFHLSKRDGYIIVSIDNKNVLLHRKIYSDFLQRDLKKNEIIHHIDLNKTNNKISNLFLTNEREHRLLHIQYNEILKSKTTPKFNKRKRCYE